MKRIATAMLAACALTLAVPAAAQEPIVLEEGVYARIDTNLGGMIVELFEDQAPDTVQNFIELAKGEKRWKNPETGEWEIDKPLYDGTTFHRLVKGFFVQGGDPAGTGKGDLGFGIPLEKAPELNHDRRGRVAMARLKDPSSASSQFYIIFKELPFLDEPPGYAVFGQVIHGMDTLDAIEQRPVGEKNRPVEDIAMEQVAILRVPAGETLEVSLAPEPPPAAFEDMTPEERREKAVEKAPIIESIPHHELFFRRNQRSGPKENYTDPERRPAGAETRYGR